MLIKKKYMLIWCSILSVFAVISSISLFIFVYNGNESDYVLILPIIYIVCLGVYIIMIFLNMMKSIILRKKVGINLEELTNKIKKDKNGKINNRLSLLFSMVGLVYIIVVVIFEYNGYINNFDISIGLIFLTFIFISWGLYFSNINFQMQYKIINDEYIDKNIEL